MKKFSTLLAIVLGSFGVTFAQFEKAPGDVYGSVVNDEVVITWPYIDEFEYDFDDGTLDEWTLIDADGDGYNWVNIKDIVTSPNHGHKGSKYAAASQSYDIWYEDGEGQCLNPDNYMVSKKVRVGHSSVLHYFVSILDDNEPDHYGICVSTKGNTDPEDFEMIYEEEVNALWEGKAGEWLERNISLEAYAGQEVYVAFRHFNDDYCTFVICVDDVRLMSSGEGNTPDSNSKSVLSENIILSEDFEGGELPQDWTKYTSGKWLEWRIDTVSDDSQDIEDRFYPYEGNYAAWCITEGDEEDVYLVTKQIDLTAVESADLSFYFMTPGWSDPEDYDINYLWLAYAKSPTGPWTKIWFNNGTNYDNKWVYANVNIDEACGELVYFAFITHDVYGPCNGIDNVTITEGCYRFDHFNVYRSANGEEYSKVGEVPYSGTPYVYREPAINGKHYYQVKSVYTNADGDEVMSNAGRSYTNYDEDFVVIEWEAIDENDANNSIEVYPNPTKNIVNIAAEGLNHINICNVAGQTVYDNMTGSDNVQLDLSRFGRGVYFVKAMTNNGVAKTIRVVVE